MDRAEAAACLRLPTRKSTVFHSSALPNDEVEGSRRGGNRRSMGWSGPVRRTPGDAPPMAGSLETGGGHGGQPAQLLHQGH